MLFEHFPCSEGIKTITLAGNAIPHKFEHFPCSEGIKTSMKFVSTYCNYMFEHFPCSEGIKTQKKLN